MECMGCYDGQKIWKEVIAVLDMSIDLERGVYISMISCRMVNHIGSTLWGPMGVQANHSNLTRAATWWRCYTVLILWSNHAYNILKY